MIKTLIFDFGDVFINLDKAGALQKALNAFEMETLPSDCIEINKNYETGTISTKTFLAFYKKRFPKLNKNQIIHLWNAILKEFPEHRLSFLQKLARSKNHTLILLSNTNALHINWIQKHVAFYNTFKACFDAFYLSHEIHLRKPNADIFQFVLETNSLIPKDCLFIDDTKENTIMAKQLGMHTWNINENTEDVTQLFSIKKELF